MRRKADSKGQDGGRPSQDTVSNSFPAGYRDPTVAYDDHGFLYILCASLTDQGVQTGQRLCQTQPVSHSSGAFSQAQQSHVLVCTWIRMLEGSLGVLSVSVSLTAENRSHGCTFLPGPTVRDMSGVYTLLPLQHRDISLEVMGEACSDCE